ncbi:MAG: universal stress protein [Betaproteobacteria bacterium]|nr:MAG: universal stress protein [Betaproteobacteria bacterium]TMH66563.1 MAG: universal stress protein [Betaproteobacteria bacterium]
MKILFPTDGSAHALTALKMLIGHLDWFRDQVELTVINVHPALPYRRAAGWAGKEAIEKYYEEESDAALKPSVDELTRRGIPHTAAKRVGEPAPMIVKAAREGAFDMIAMGTQGHTALATLMLGSVSAKVLADAPVPVLLLR